MQPLFFANWKSIHARFRALMWLLALGLTIVVLVNAQSSFPQRHSAPRGSPILSGGSRR